MRQTIFSITMLVLAGNATAASIQLSCSELLELRAIAQARRQEVDFEIRRNRAEMTKPFTCLRVPIEPILMLSVSGEAPLVATGKLADERIFLFKKFYDSMGLIRYHEGLNHLRQLGIPAAEVLEVDYESDIAIVTYLDLLELEYLPMQGPLQRKLIPLRHQAITRADRSGVLEKPLRPGNVQLDLDTMEFTVIDIH